MMKSVIAIALLLFALSFCNLLGRRTASNSNSTPPSNRSEETAQAENSNASREEAPPGVPAAPPGVQTLTDGNQNTSANRPERPKTISGGVLNGKATRLVQPTYPPIAKAAHVSGTVNVQVTIDEDGNVISATAISGHPLLQASAVAAARASKFSPTIIGGHYVKVTGVIVYNFVEK